MQKISPDESSFVKEVADQTISTEIPYRFYTDPDIYQQEQIHIFGGRSWNYVGLGAEIPKFGDFKRTTVGNIPVILVRAKDGTVNAFVNQCTHHGAQLCLQNFGNTTSFQCPYHQWNFDTQGNLRGIPFQKGMDGKGGIADDFDPKSYGLHKLYVTERHGVFFASFEPNMEPFEEYLGPTMLNYFDRVFDGRELYVLGYSRQVINSNWKLIFENTKDPYHATILHAFLVTFGLWRADQRSEVRIDKTGRHACLISCKGEQVSTQVKEETTSFINSMKLQGPQLLEATDEFSGYETCVMQTLYPNLIVQQQVNTLATRQIVPCAPDRSEIVWTFFGYADDTPEIKAQRLRQANLMGPAGYVSADDGEILQCLQNGIHPYDQQAAVLKMGGNGCEDADHMLTESASRAFYTYYRNVMGV